jgi:hypothetical protein
MIYPKEKLHNWFVRFFKFFPEKKKDQVSFKYAIEILIEDVEKYFKENTK